MVCSRVIMELANGPGLRRRATQLGTKASELSYESSGNRVRSRFPTSSDTCTGLRSTKAKLHSCAMLPPGTPGRPLHGLLLENYRNSWQCSEPTWLGGTTAAGMPSSIASFDIENGERTDTKFPGASSAALGPQMKGGRKRKAHKRERGPPSPPVQGKWGSKVVDSAGVWCLRCNPF